MPKTRTKLLGKAEIARRLNKLPAHFQEAAARYNRRAGNDVRSEAVRLMNAQAVDTGRGKTAIKLNIYRDGLTVEVVADFDYAAFIEFGTGPRGRQTIGDVPLPAGWVYHSGNGGLPPLELIRRWCTRHNIEESAAFAIALKIARMGLPARPFMYPAWMGVERGYLRAMTKILKAAAEEAKGL